jgi:hypothetical protein
VGRLIEERPGIPLADVELAAAPLREALHDKRGAAVLRALLEVGRLSDDRKEPRNLGRCYLRDLCTAARRLGAGLPPPHAGAQAVVSAPADELG